MVATFSFREKKVSSFRDIAGKWTWWANGPSSPKNMGRGYGGRLRPPLGPGQRPGRGFREAKPPEKIWVLRHFKGHFFLNSDTYFSQKMSRNILRKMLEKFLFLFSLRFYLLFSNWNNINNTDWGLQEMVNWHADISHAFSQISQSMIPSHVCTDLDYHWIPTDPTVTVRCTYILIDLDHVLKPIVSLLTIKTTK